jgi:hypothetical protein
LEYQALNELLGSKPSPRSSKAKLLLCNKLQGFVIEITFKWRVV